VVRAESSSPGGCGFESRHILDGSYYMFNEKGNKDSQMGHTKIEVKQFDFVNQLY
jgi:hypothetical protein